MPLNAWAGFTGMNCLPCTGSVKVVLHATSSFSSSSSLLESVGVCVTCPIGHYCLGGSAGAELCRAGYSCPFELCNSWLVVGRRGWPMRRWKVLTPWCCFLYELMCRWFLRRIRDHHLYFLRAWKVQWIFRSRKRML
ncbi:hypothetical protein TrLO_g10443 [Triparma laevis f. longispina]|uniref:Uncharacterized protein n=1 Tax=Triparma laevis f. longispina TaxID=1714387 RepID=A0A9W7F4K2_9STRA|nr:hypothetical protein TrLO_g10443 [Triparma laevis f. longispina]